MIIKKTDSKQDEINELYSLLKDNNISPDKRFMIEKELKSIKLGANGESESAYYIDFYYASSQNWAIIHDLRIEHDGLVAQIDHLLINRLFEIYVIESKYYSYGIEITPNGEFSAVYGDKNYGIPSPIEQNKRHIDLLQRLFHDYAILPKRLGIYIKPNLRNIILISPKSVIKRPDSKIFNSDIVIKADTLKTEIDKDANGTYNPISNIATLSKFCPSKTLKESAKKLASYHKPMKINFRAKFGINDSETLIKNKTSQISSNINEPEDNSKYYCASCKVSITEKAAKYCWQNKNIFKGRPYCYNCQKQFKP